MKKLCFLLILALLLSLGASAFADNGVEIIIMDGVPVVFESFAYGARGIAVANPGDGAAFALPSLLVNIEEEAFAGIAAECVEITEKVVSIGPRAFADCPDLEKLVIPKTVESIDDTALEGTPKVTVYGETGSEAERFAEAAKVPFVPTNAESKPREPDRPPVALPYVAFKG